MNPTAGPLVAKVLSRILWVDICTPQGRWLCKALGWKYAHCAVQVVDLVYDLDPLRPGRWYRSTEYCQRVSVGREVWFNTSLDTVKPNLIEGLRHQTCRLILDWTLAKPVRATHCLTPILGLLRSNEIDTQAESPDELWADLCNRPGCLPVDRGLYRPADYKYLQHQ